MRLATALLSSAAVLLAGTIVVAQAPQGPPGGGAGRGAPQPPMTNLQVFPKDATRQQVVGAMQQFTQALGVTCAHCHDWEQGRATNDMASDAKPAKVVARAMMDMGRGINPMVQKAVAPKAAADVRAVGCWTCHRGAAIPEAPPALPARGGGPPAGGPPPGGRGN